MKNQEVLEEEPEMLGKSQGFYLIEDWHVTVFSGFRTYFLDLGYIFQIWDLFCGFRVLN